MVAPVTIQGGITIEGGITIGNVPLPPPPSLELNLDAAGYTSGPWVDTVASNSFTLYNGVTYSGDGGGSLVFDPALSQYAQGSSLGMSLTTWSIVTWLYHDATNMGGGGSPCVVTEVYAGNPINFTMGNTQDAFPNLQTGTFNGAWASTGLGHTLTTGNWYQLVGTWDGTSVKLYINNSLVDTQTFPGFSSVTGNQGIRLMRRWDAGQYWGGKLGIVQVWQGALSATAVANDWNANKTRFGL